MAHGCYLVIFPCVEIDVADPCLNGTRLRLHGHESTMHEMHHVAYRVHGRHLLLYKSLFIVEQLHGMWLVEIIVDRVGAVLKLVRQIFVYRKLLCYAFDESWNDLVVLVLPRFLVAPMVLEVALHDLHLLYGSLFSILLHARVEGGVYFQT